MDRIIKFFDTKIIEFILIFLGIYIVLYILNINIHLIVTISLFCAVFYYRYINRENEKKIILTKKKNEMFNNNLPSKLNEHDQILNFLYFINDFKQYNQQIYDDLLINLNDFLTLITDYQIIQGTKKKLMEDVIFDTKHKILDGLSSFIYSFNNSPVLRNKLNESINKLNEILNEYISKEKIVIDNINAFNNYL